MKLYHVSFDINPVTEKLFIPKIPESVASEMLIPENNTIKRICLAPTVELCMQAICHTKMTNGAKFMLYAADIDKMDPHLIHPGTLYTENLVPDALENREYWYTEKLLMTAQKCRIENYEYYHDIAWSCIRQENLIEDILDLARDYGAEFRVVIKNILQSSNKSPRQLYDTVMKEAHERRLYQYEDDMDDRIAEHPWAKLLRITSVSYKTIKMEETA